MSVILLTNVKPKADNVEDRQEQQEWMDTDKLK